MSVKKYKLVPISFFDSVGEKDDKMENRDASVNEDARSYRDDSVNEDARSLKDIASTELHNTNFEPSNHYVAEFKIGKSNDSSVSGGGVVSKNKLEVSNKQEDDNMKFIDEILSNTSIPEDLKIKLYMVLRQKYDQSKENIENKIENDDGNDDATSHRGALGKVIADLHSTKAKAGYTLANILLDHPQHIRWNSDGIITHPILEKNKAFNLKMLVKSVLYKKTPKSHTDIALRIIKPFYEKLKQAGVLLNDNLILSTPQVLSQYVSW